MAIIHRFGEDPARWTLNADHDSLGALIQGQRRPQAPDIGQNSKATLVVRSDVPKTVPNMSDDNDRSRTIYTYDTVYPLLFLIFLLSQGGLE